MNCPRCDHEMKATSLNGSELDVCPACEGIWFDKDEMETVLDTSEGEIAESGIAPSWQAEVERKEKPGNDDFTCPRCGGVMNRYCYCMVPDIVVDGCEKGCGVFTDDGEIRKIWKYIQDTKAPLSPEEEARIKAIMDKVKADQEMKEEALIDSLVKMDNQPGMMRYPGKVLQFIYRLLYKSGA